MADIVDQEALITWTICKDAKDVFFWANNNPKGVWSHYESSFMVSLWIEANIWGKRTYPRLHFPPYRQKEDEWCDDEVLSHLQLAH